VNMNWWIKPKWLILRFCDLFWSGNPTKISCRVGRFQCTYWLHCWYSWHSVHFKEWLLHVHRSAFDFKTSDNVQTFLVINSIIKFYFLNFF
jgi:hypothetical protein